MASGDKEHKMLFDLRGGRRRNVVKVVYGVLAVLMGTSLFLTVGPLNIGELFSNSSNAGNAAEPFEEQTERLQAKLRRDPGDEQLLVSLVRSQILTGNSLLSLGATEDEMVRALQQYQQASNTWSEYLKVAQEPSPSTAQLMAPALVTLAERSRSLPEAATNIEAAREAQQIVAQKRPTVNSLTTLALYTYFTGDFAAAEKAEAKAIGMAREKSQREQIEKQLGEIEKNAKKFQKQLKEAEAATKAAAKGNGGAPESLQSPSNPLSGAFGGTGGLGE